MNVGIIGFGRIGNEHAQWLAQASGVRATTTFDPTPARRELAESRGLRAVEQLDQLLGDDSIDAVLVSTPTSMHFEHAARALEAGKHVLVEKPMALDFPQSQRLVELAAKHRRMLSVFHNRRWDVDYLTVKQAIDAGAFGRIFNIESRLGQWASCVGPAAREWRPQWRNEAEFGGGGLYDWGSHFVDQIWQLMLPAKPVRLFAQLRGNVWTRDCDDFARVCIDFDNGAAGLVEISTTTTRPLPRWHIDGERGSADSPFSLALDTQAWAKLSFTPCEGSTRELPLAPPGMTETQVWEQFARACRGEGEPAVTANSVLFTMKLLDAARDSARRGEAIKID
jgi:scyllo-inositol 2-dehydrogenase (NADP+)